MVSLAKVSDLPLTIVSVVFGVAALIVAALEAPPKFRMGVAEPRVRLLARSTVVLVLKVPLPSRPVLEPRRVVPPDTLRDFPLAMLITPPEVSKITPLLPTVSERSAWINPLLSICALTVAASELPSA